MCVSTVQGHKQKTIMCILVFLFLALTINIVYAVTYHLPVDTVISDGLTANFGDQYIGTSGTDIHITAWHESNWLNYTVDSAGTQTVYNGSKPTTVYLDGVEKGEDDGWTYTGGLVTLTSAASSAALSWSGSTQPETPTFIVPGAAIPVTWYLRGDTRSTNEILGYKLAETQSSVARNDSRSTVGSYIVSYGARVWIVHSDDTTTEITSGSPVAIVTRSANGAGLQTGYWNCTGYDRIVDATMIRVYQRFGSQSWSLRATFVSQHELLVKLPEATWGFNFYTEYVTSSTTGRVYWGSTAYNSTVSFYYTVPSIYDKMQYRLSSADLIGFLTLPFTNYIGTLFYGFLVLVMGITLYQRTESIVPVALMLMVFGGSAGIVTMMIPTAGLQLSWVFFVFGLAILFYKLIKART